MKKSIIALSILFFVNFTTALATQDSDETATTQDLTEQPEASTSSKIVLFAMTAAGVILIGLSIRNSKWGKKK